MKRLLQKEVKLSMHPTMLIFLLFPVMLLIPSYPYYIVFFYLGLAVFFTCLSGRENQDILYMMGLPVEKQDVVGARMTFVVIAQLLSLFIAIPFAILRQKMPVGGNPVGMDANLTLFGLSLLLFGLFNLTFFPLYYKDVNKVGRAFIISSTAVFLYIAVAEALTHVLPLFRDVLDTPDPENLVPKLVTLAIGLFLFAAMTAIAGKISVKRFLAQDL